MKKIAFILLTIISLKSYTQSANLITDYLEVIEETGQEPVKFVNNKLEDFDLLIFDDALHIAKEPFDFYQKLIKDNSFKDKVKYLFVEVFSTTAQAAVEEYLNSPVKDSAILLPVFQNTYSGYGWRYKTYLDLLGAIWEVNASLVESQKIQVICVGQPIYWKGIETRNDYDLFQESLIGRDYFMYRVILKKLEDFGSGEKGIFLTNTRHAYKGIKKANGKFYWNTGTFFKQWHPDKTYSIRFHNVTLSIQAKVDSVQNSSTEGLDKISYNWVRMENGIWDKAFRKNNNVSVAISLENNVFGEAAYVGNHMLNVADKQTMYDAYDALIFLKPLEELTFSAKIDFIYTDSFRVELKRRIEILQEEKLATFLTNNEADSLDDFITQFAKYEEQSKNSLVPVETN